MNWFRSHHTLRSGKNQFEDEDDDEYEDDLTNNLFRSFFIEGLTAY
jgi:hypothetical protein